MHLIVYVLLLCIGIDVTNAVCVVQRLASHFSVMLSSAHVDDQ